MLCLYSRHLCHRERLSGYDYCSAHILEDKTAPFKQCAYPIKTHTAANLAALFPAPSGSASAAFPLGAPSTTLVTRRCHRPASKTLPAAAAASGAKDKRESYCAEHTRRALLARQIVGFAPPVTANPNPPSSNPAPGARKRRAGSSAAASDYGATHVSAHKYLKDLSHYDGLDADEKETVAKRENDGKAEAPKGKKNDAFHRVSIPTSSQRAFDGGFSEVDSAEDDDAAHTVEAAWRGDGDESDAESVDSDMEDPLKHAGAYSAEEVIRMMRDKLIRLQKLYIEQFQRLQYLLKEERRQYCHSVRKERDEQLMSIHAQPKETPEEVAAYEAVRALNHYNKPQGMEALLYGMLMEKRQRAAANTAQHSLSDAAAASVAATGGGSSSLQKCTFNITTNTKCGDASVPMSKLCMKHIMADPTQMLFRACGVTTTADDGPCETPVPDLCETTACVFHTPIQSSVYEEKETYLTEASKEPPQVVVQLQQSA